MTPRHGQAKQGMQGPLVGDCAKVQQHIVMVAVDQMSMQCQHAHSLLLRRCMTSLLPVAHDRTRIRQAQLLVLCKSGAMLNKISMRPLQQRCRIRFCKVVAELYEKLDAWQAAL